VSALLLSVAIALGTTSSLRGQDPSVQPALQDLPSAEAVIDRFVEAIGGRAAILAHSSRIAKLTFAGPLDSLREDPRFEALRQKL
jgi:hypothetical protein